jgi:hypothetical protein
MPDIACEDVNISSFFLYFPVYYLLCNSLLVIFAPHILHVSFERLAKLQEHNFKKKQQPHAKFNPWIHNIPSNAFNNCKAVEGIVTSLMMGTSLALGNVGKLLPGTYAHN